MFNGEHQFSFTVDKYGLNAHGSDISHPNFSATEMVVLKVHSRDP